MTAKSEFTMACRKTQARDSRTSPRILALTVGLLMVSAVTVRAAETSAASSRNDLKALLDAGQQHYQARRYREALEAFETALAVADTASAPKIRRYLAAVLAALGLEHVGSGENRLAAETFERALQYEKDFYAHLGLGYLYFLRLEDGPALNQLQSALELGERVTRPRDLARAHKLLALLEYRQGRTREATQRLEESIRHDAGDREAATLLARWRVEASFLRRFAEIPSKRFLVRVDPEVAPPVQDRVVREMYRIYDDVGDSLGLWPDRRVPVVLYSEASFHLATGAYHWVGGMYDGQLKVPVPFKALPRGDELESFRQVLRHEYAHVLIRQLAPECPIWLNEGVAQYLERKTTRGAIERLLYAQRSRRLPLHEIPARLWEVDDEELARQSYLQGLGFVAYLADRFHEFRLRLVLGAIAEEHSVTRAFERVYGATLETLEGQWWQELEERVASGESRTEVDDNPKR